MVRGITPIVSIKYFTTLRLNCYGNKKCETLLRRRKYSRRMVGVLIVPVCFLLIVVFVRLRPRWLTPKSELRSEDFWSFTLLISFRIETLFFLSYKIRNILGKIGSNTSIE